MRGATNAANLLVLSNQPGQTSPTQYHTAPADAVSRSTVGRTRQPVENRLIQCRSFRRPSNRELLESQTNIQGVRVDVSEQAMERAKTQSRHYGGQKKYTPPAQLIINQHR
ncbi:hypothetical protein CMK12_10780 [Candidatus Poribacteria bacterium]|nr:hypothetical protein [Candidatus Poribacteria bacterium]MDP6596336.1 hypothetical protein [Candidatus Poribacteria bacterium]MDP6996953.1 hypothetical protein [Candidatus Poribacteria bacterium]